MIQDVDGILHELLIGELKKVRSLIQESTQLRFQSISEIDPGTPSRPNLNLFLHDIRENLSFRDATFHVSRPDTGSSVAKRRGPVTLDLSYIATVQAGGDSSVEHRVLSDVLSVLLRNSVVPSEYMAPVAGEESPPPIVIAVAQPDHPAHADSAKLWQALGDKLRPTIGIVVTASFNPFESKEVRVVLELVTALRKGVDPNRGGPADVVRVQVGIAGLVIANGKPLGGIDVELADLALKASTDERGFFYFTNIPAGKHRVIARCLGYEPLELDSVAPPVSRANEIQPLVFDMLATHTDSRVNEDSALLASGLDPLAFLEVERKAVTIIRGRLRRPDGTPAAFVPVRCESQMSATDSNGVYEFENVSSPNSPIIAEVSGHGDVPVNRSGDGHVLALLAAEASEVTSIPNGSPAITRKVQKPRG